MIDTVLILKQLAIAFVVVVMGLILSLILLVLTGVYLGLYSISEAIRFVRYIRSVSKRFRNQSLRQ